MRYFHCAQGHGIFVAARAVAKAGASYRPKEPETRSRAPQKVFSNVLLLTQQLQCKKFDILVYCKIFTLNICKVVHHGKVDVSHVQAKFHSAMAVIAERTEVQDLWKTTTKEALTSIFLKHLCFFNVFVSLPSLFLHL